MPGTLLLCSSPIGNLNDAPPRLAEALGAADVIYAEDTRRARVLLDRLGVSTKLVSYFAGNEARRESEIFERLRAGETVAVITDAGTPGISDPGLSAVRAAVSAGATVSGVPGPSAVTFSLALAGLPAERFVFEGFLPRKGRARSERISAVVVEPRTVVLFCAPSRLVDDLAALTTGGAGDRECVVLRELTKLHEEVWRGTVATAAAHWGSVPARGEVTVVVGPADPEGPTVDDASARVAALVADGLSRSEAVRQAAAETGVSRRELYERTIGVP
ncbi:MAG TPA: 16S rRNA (cytidine(1402)-2'-O)-methyltransferase [Acidimicrobiia bacterium]|nr:16S rRNA (cytidine(1402)-2'-O)-methyltransferase [Acidimicrobiia bacterium]